MRAIMIKYGELMIFYRAKKSPKPFSDSGPSLSLLGKLIYQSKLGRKSASRACVLSQTGHPQVSSKNTLIFCPVDRCRWFVLNNRLHPFQGFGVQGYS